MTLIPIPAYNTEIFHNAAFSMQNEDDERGLRIDGSLISRCLLYILRDARYFDGFLSSIASLGASEPLLFIATLPQTAWWIFILMRYWPHRAIPLPLMAAPPCALLCLRRRRQATPLAKSARYLRDIWYFDAIAFVALVLGHLRASYAHAFFIVLMRALKGKWYAWGFGDIRFPLRASKLPACLFLRAHDTIFAILYLSESFLYYYQPF